MLPICQRALKDQSNLEDKSKEDKTDEKPKRRRRSKQDAHPQLDQMATTVAAAAQAAEELPAGQPEADVADAVELGEAGKVEAVKEESSHEKKDEKVLSRLFSYSIPCFRPNCDVLSAITPLTASTTNLFFVLCSLIKLFAVLYRQSSHPHLS